jgi:type IV pilus assembly protein PilB
VAEKRRPQDGRIRMKLLGRDIDLRVSALPASHGPSLVMRILDKESVLLGVQDLGFGDDDYRRFKNIIKRPNGIFLVTGPTGSGKTTTLYAALNELNTPDRKIITAENPVEYSLTGINQAEVRERIGMSFARILRAMLRQAPNIILVGEIRDTETAEIAIQAALTGHLVFSTLHTNDAPSAITRLIDMGVQPFLVSSSIQAIMAQRLVRTVCKNCKEPYEAPEHELRAVGLTPDDVSGVTLYRGGGCPECQGTGYKGRIGIFEMMELDSELRDMAFHKAATNRIRDQAIASGMRTLMQDGIRKVIQGITTIDEVLRITAGDLALEAAGH